jgi:hypothetical protein
MRLSWLKLVCINPKANTQIPFSNYILRSGKDATEAFEDVGHSDEAREVLNTLYIGDFDGADVSNHKS